MQADHGNRCAAPYLHAMSGFAWNADLVRARLKDAPALKYSNLDPNSRRPEDLKAPEPLVLAVRPYLIA